MHPRAQGSLLIWHDTPPDHFATLNVWNNHEHQPERIDVPGFLSANRYHASDGAASIFLRYEVLGADILKSPSYLERLNNPTPLSRSNHPYIKNMCRIASTLVHRTGVADGGHLATIRWFSEAGQASAASHLPWNAVISVLAENRSELLSAELYTADKGISSIPSQEKAIRGTPDLHPSDALLLHGTSLAALDLALESLIASVPAIDTQDAIIGTYDLAYALRGEV
jgi:hypothetical protein